MGMYAEKGTQIAINAQTDVIIPMPLPIANEVLVMNLVELLKVELNPISLHNFLLIFVLSTNYKCLMWIN